MQAKRQVRKSARPWVILFLILPLLSLISSGRCWSAPAAEVNVSAGPGADEELFLLYLLPVLYQSNFEAYDAPDEAERKRLQDEVRQRAVKIRQHTEEAKLDPRVTRLYGDFLAVLDAIETTKAEIARSVGAVKRTNGGRNLKRGIERSAAVGIAAIQFKELAGKNDGKTFDSVVVGAGAMLATALFDLAYEGYKDVRAASEAEAAAREAKMAEFRRFLAEIYARSFSIAHALVKERGWTDVEVVNEAAVQRATHYAAAWQSKDYTEALRLIRQVLAFNPRSFFAHQAEETILASWTNRTPQQRLESARHLIAACRLVPDAAIYEEYRVSALGDAAILCLEASAEESRRTGRLWQPNDTSSYAVAVLEETVRRASPAQRPVLNWLLAMAYGANHQFSAAEKLTESLRSVETLLAEQVPGTAGSLDFIQACIDSRQGETPSALKFLQKAVGGGWAVSKDWWEDADLESLRTAHPKEFAELLAVKASWTIDFGVLLDDVVVRNDSAFALSSVRINVGVVSKGKRHDRELRTEAIPPGKIHRWSNVFSIPRDPDLTGGLVLESEQTPSAVTATFLAPAP